MAPYSAWIGELPTEWQYVVEQWLEFHLQTQGKQIDAPRYAAYRRFAAHQYAALGASFVPNDTNQLVVRIGVGVSAFNREPSLSAEFAQVVLTECGGYSGLLLVLGNGILSVKHALDHPVDSTEFAFRLATHTVLHLLKGQNLEEVPEYRRLYWDRATR